MQGCFQHQFTINLQIMNFNQEKIVLSELKGFLNVSGCCISGIT